MHCCYVSVFYFSMNNLEFNLLLKATLEISRITFERSKLATFWLPPHYCKHFLWFYWAFINTDKSLTHNSTVEFQDVSCSQFTDGVGLTYKSSGLQWRTGYKWSFWVFTFKWQQTPSHMSRGFLPEHYTTPEKVIFCHFHDLSLRYMMMLNIYSFH